MIHHGDCLDVMAAMEPASVDAIVTDPPYGLEFMGKEWDRLGRDGPASFENLGTAKGLPPERRSTRTDGGSTTSTRYRDKPRFSTLTGQSMRAAQRWHQQWAEAAYRVAKPSAYLLAFGGTRTVHRMTVALEDAGWIIRDMLVWGYASGFPKSKASLKPAWEPIVMARKPGPLRMLAIDECRIPADPVDLGDPERFVGLSSRDSLVYEGGERGRGDKRPAGERIRTAMQPTIGRWPANIVLTDPIFDGGIEGVVGGGETAPGGERGERQPFDSYSGGWAGTPEPAPVGRQGTYSRFFLIPKADRADREPVLGGLPVQHAGVGIRAAEPGEYLDFVYPPPEGIGKWLRDHRLAAGLSAKELTGRIGAHGAVNHGGAVSNWEAEANRPTPEQWRGLRDVLGFDDRYDEVMTTTREVPRTLMEGVRAQRQNNHPTVKPTDLMRHLVRLVTPTGGTVLDPFLGSGSTALAAEMEGFPWIGIEREAEYVAIAEARLNGTQRGLGLEAI